MSIAVALLVLRAPGLLRDGCRYALFRSTNLRPTAQRAVPLARVRTVYKSKTIDIRLVFYIQSRVLTVDSTRGARAAARPRAAHAAHTHERAGTHRVLVTEIEERRCRSAGVLGRARALATQACATKPLPAVLAGTVEEVPVLGSVPARSLWARFCERGAFQCGDWTVTYLPRASWRRSPDSLELLSTAREVWRVDRNYDGATTSSGDSGYRLLKTVERSSRPLRSAQAALPRRRSLSCGWRLPH